MSTNITKVSEVTPITRVIGCLKSYYDQNIANDDYKEYTLYLVNTGSEIEGQGWSDFYYGDRKVTDIFVVDHYPADEEYPDNKLYLQKIVPDDETWKLSGDQEVTPVGFNIYYKNNGVLIPVSSNVIANVQYNPLTGFVDLVWNLQDGTQAVTEVVTKEYIDYYLTWKDVTDE